MFLAKSWYFISLNNTFIYNFIYCLNIWASNSVNNNDYNNYKRTNTLCKLHATVISYIYYCICEKILVTSLKLRFINKEFKIQQYSNINDSDYTNHMQWILFQNIFIKFWFWLLLVNYDSWLKFSYQLVN